MNRSGPDSFGTMLKGFRTRRGLAQHQLAEKLGVRRNTIGSWERGDFLPRSKGAVLELAKHLRLDDQETRQLLEVSFTALAPYWLVPLQRNPFFTGREEILEALHTHLSGNQMVALTQSAALHGLGGVGKTQLALEYAYRHALEYSAIFWIAAETTEHIIFSLLQIAEVLQVPGRDDKDQQHVVATVQNWLSTHPHWLLIWDNVEDLDLLARFLPKVRAGAILLTTRHVALGPLAWGIDLLPMDQEEGMLFLLRRAKLLEQEAGREQVDWLARRRPAEYAAAEVLVTKMGMLPLALDQVGAYCEETGCGLSDYLQRYEHHQVRLLSRRGSLGRDHPHSVSATFKLAIEQVEREQCAADVLRICALVQAEAIPEELFIEGGTSLGPNLAVLNTDSSHFDQAVAVLRNLSLLQRHPETHTLSIHRLVQAVVGDWMSEQEQVAWLKRLIVALNALFPKNAADVPAWEQCERLLSHVLAVAATLPASTGTPELVEVLRKAADYLRERAQYERAEQVYRQALYRGEQQLGSKHPALAPALSGLAALCGAQGKYEQAEALGSQALYLSEQVLEPGHPRIAASLTTLATLYADQGKHAQAQPLFERAISIWEQTPGQDHSQVAVPLSRLALLYWRQGKYAQAEPLFRRALSIWQQTREPESLQVAQSLYNLALLYWKQGQYKQAEPLFERARSLWECAYGPQHPQVAYALRGAAILSAEQGKYAQAETMFQQELYIWQQLWGPQSHQVAVSLTNLGQLYAEQGKNEQAEPVLQQAWQIEEGVWGSKSHQVAYPLYVLAEIYTTHGKYEQAESLFRRVLHIWQMALGPEHPEVATAFAGFGRLRLAQGKNEQAKEMLQRALAIQEQQLGPDHPETAYTLHELAIGAQKQNRLNEALAIAGRALQIREQALGDAHPKTATTRTLYAQLVRACSDVEESHQGSQEQGVQNSNQIVKTQEEEGAPLSMPAVTPCPVTEHDPLEAFLSACCELHPLACCTIRELWHTYEHWTATEQGRVPFPRRVFAAQLKARGCRVDRTSTARIWRGIRLVKTMP